MPETISSVDELARVATARLEPIIAIDGMPGAGKSTLASTLSRMVGCPIVGCDDYLRKGEETFLGALRYDDIRRDLDDALASTRGKVVFEGVCLQEVMHRLGRDRASAAIIYVKRMSGTGEWADSGDLEATPPSVRAAVEALSGEEYVTPALRIEIREYHVSWAPDTTADLIFERSAED
jgi:hypothetical protein